VLDPEVLVNRTFLTAAIAGLLSLFGLTAVMVYLPLFLQGVQSASATLSGQVLTPFSVLMAFMGVPAGFLIARTRRYKWMYIAGYAVLTATMFGMVLLTEKTPVIWSFAVSTMAGLGLGTIPTINALVAQYAVPRRLLGVATGAMYFFVVIGAAVAPAILGSVMNGTYTKTLEAVLPAELGRVMDPTTRASLADPRVLLSADALTALQGSFQNAGDREPALLEQTVRAIRSALEEGLRAVFWIGAATMAISFLLILTIPEIAIGAEISEQESVAEASPAS
jgi:MFS family permease